MKVCVFGAGAVGGLLAAQLSQAGVDVSIIARGEHLEAIQRDGLTLVQGEERRTFKMPASDDPADLGEQDFVLVTVKSTALRGLPGVISPLLGEETAVVFAQNGIPWWYPYGLSETAPRSPEVDWLDPDGDLRALLKRTIGAVVMSANEVIEPGVVLNVSTTRNRLIVGEPDDSQSERITALRDVLERAGVGSPATSSIRTDIWTKLVMNMTGSVLCAVMGESMRTMRESGLLDEILERLHREACAIAQAHCPDIDIAAPLRVRSGHKPSILQDLERRRPMEIDALVAAPLAFARAAGLETPSLDLLGGLAAFRAQEAGLYAPSRLLPIAP
ncbi:MAG: 2-dehydropantoate 2-reductase [Maricaulaceae bacterium]|jgi:2-dehydropantoate 2-reductase